MTLRIGSNFKPPPGYTLFFDASIPESYSGEGSTWTNLSGNGNNCSLVNPSFMRMTSGAGCFYTNGSQCGNVSVVNLNGSFTITAWVQKYSTSGTGWIYGGGWVATNSGIGLGVSLGVQGTRVILTTWAESDGTPTASNITSDYGLIGNDKWYNISAVQDGLSRFARIYIDGVEVGSGSYYNALYYTTGGSTTNFIGQRSHPGGESWYGLTSQVIVYNGTILTQNQLADHFKQTKGRYGR